MDITDTQWEIIRVHLPRMERQIKPHRGRPFQDARTVLDGILWILRTGAPWHDLPKRYPPYQTCHRRFQGWIHSGVLERVLTSLAQDLEKRGGINIVESFIDGSFAPAKKGGPKSGRLSGEKAQKSWLSETAMVFLSPLGLRVLAHMKLGLLKKQLSTDSLNEHRKNLSETKLTIAIH